MSTLRELLNRNAIKRVGTLNEQLLAVERYLAVPKYVRDEIGTDELWEKLYNEVMDGIETPVIDEDFRKAVLQMRESQKAIGQVKDDKDQRRELIRIARANEAVVDNHLRRWIDG